MDQCNKKVAKVPNANKENVNQKGKTAQVYVPKSIPVNATVYASNEIPLPNSNEGSTQNNGKGNGVMNVSEEATVQGAANRNDVNG